MNIEYSRGLAFIRMLVAMEPQTLGSRATGTKKAIVERDVTVS